MVRSTPATLPQQVRQQFEVLLAKVAAAGGQRLDRVEGWLLSDLCAIGKLLVEQFIAAAGDGDRGETLRAGAQEWRRLKPRKRRYLSIFGEIQFVRRVYGTHERRKVQAAPLDETLGLPRRDCSYLLQQWLEERCLDTDYAGAVAGLAAILPVNPSVRTAESLAAEMAEDARSFDPDPPRAAEPGSLLIASVDGKGVPMVPRDRPRKAEAKADDEDRGETPGRPGTKRMAYAGAVYEITPFVRTAADVLDETQRKKRAKQRPKPQAKAVFAELPQSHDDGSPLGGRDAAWANVAAELDRRDPSGTRKVHVLIDGEKALAATPALMLTRPFQLILDLMHALAYLWLAAKACCPGNGRKQRTFVTRRLRQLLTGGAAAVAAELRRTSRTMGRKNQAGRDLAKAAGYLSARVTLMNYDECLAAGLPIASGVIEGACRHLIKDRMERAGMKWTIAGAQAVLRLRAVHESGRWMEFQERRIGHEQAALHGSAARHAPRLAA